MQLDLIADRRFSSGVKFARYAMRTDDIAAIALRTSAVPNERDTVSVDLACTATDSKR